MGDGRASSSRFINYDKIGRYYLDNIKCYKQFQDDARINAGDGNAIRKPKVIAIKMLFLQI